MQNNTEPNTENKKRRRFENIFFEHKLSERGTFIRPGITSRFFLMLCVPILIVMFFVYTYFCGAVYDDMVCSKMELALFSARWIQEFLIVRWLENGKKLFMKDVEEISWRYAREVEHSDDNLNALEDWLFERYAPV